MGKNRLPEGYKSAAQLLKEFREKNPDGVITTSALVSNGDYVIVTATVKTKDSTATGIADADLQEGKGSSKAESAAIRRALVHLGFESVESDEADEDDEKESKPAPKSENRFSKKSKVEEEDEESEDDADDEEEEEKPKSRFGSKKKSSRDEDEESEDDEEGEPKFQRGSRFKRG
jgi:hypothetical protein